MSEEKLFYETLQNILVGTKAEGQGGFVNLTKIKSKYYSKIEELLRNDIEEALQKYPAFRDELFNNLYSFFSRYFTEDGSIYLKNMPYSIYGKTYTDDKDVALFQKMQIPYYIKTDRIFRSMSVEFNGLKFYHLKARRPHLLQGGDELQNILLNSLTN